MMKIGDEVSRYQVRNVSGKFGVFVTKIPYLSTWASDDKIDAYGDKFWSYILQSTCEMSVTHFQWQILSSTEWHFNVKILVTSKVILERSFFKYLWKNSNPEKPVGIRLEWQIFFCLFILFIYFISILKTSVIMLSTF